MFEKGPLIDLSAHLVIRARHLSAFGLDPQYTTETSSLQLLPECASERQ
jgi:hypothetical protein